MGTTETIRAVAETRALALVRALRVMSNVSTSTLLLLTSEMRRYCQSICAAEGLFFTV